MDPADFQGLLKYKLLLPALYLINWGLMLAGPLLFPPAYQRFTIVVFGYMLLKTVFNFAWCLVGFVRGTRYLDQAAAKKIEKAEGGTDNLTSPLIEDGINDQIYHLFVIPSYREETELLSQTINQLASHSAAKQRYLVVLAMEAHEEGSIDKAKELIAKHLNQFKSVTYTHHVMRPLEQKGKASNVSWCV